MIERTPNVEYHKPPEPLAPGTYTGEIIEFGSPTISHANAGWFRIPVRVKIGTDVMVDHLFGSFSTVTMIYRARKHWLGKTVQVQVQHKMHPGYNAMHIDIRIEWPLEID